MKWPSPIERYLTVKPSVRSMTEIPSIVVVGILGEVFDWARLPFSPYVNIVGGAMLVAGLLVHSYCHKVHRQGHEETGQIQFIVTTGVFASVRHPMYTSVFLIYFGLALVWGIVWMLVPATFFSIITVAIAVKEEQLLLQRFGSEYEGYLRKVPYRFIPHVV
ncbi:MAG: isoprenylcysteine carboxylmethyltransferase family protein [Dehalococcoidia bacterium]|nr:isoprenylcysteine carboxylmethyltransferase family protein [Dehalococcoidia bacterium]